MARSVSPDTRHAGRIRRIAGHVRRLEGTSGYAAPAFLALCILLGGGGPHAPVASLAVELVAVLVLALLFALPAAADRARLSRGAWAVILAVLVLFAVQLVPLPAAWWSRLPGRTLLAEALMVEQGRLSPHSLSIDPNATVDMLFAFLVPLASFAAATRTDAAGRRRMAGVVVGSALLGVAVEALQFAGAGVSNLYVREGSGTLPTGLFANHNHQACFLAVAIAFLAPLGDRIAERQSPAAALAGVAAVQLILLVGVVGTQSRAGALLAIAASAWLLAGYWRWWRAARSRRAARGIRRLGPIIRRYNWPLTIAALAAVAAILALNSTPAQQFIGRFSDLHDKRTSYLPDLWNATSAFLPWGSGLGSYPIVFHAYEDLDLLSPTFFNHAHDDYYELLMEAGLPVLLVLAGFALFLAYAAVVAFRDRSREASLRRTALVIVALVLVHSLVDYPLRTHALAAVLGFALVVLARRERVA